jgi:hypothetical protein
MTGRPVADRNTCPAISLDWPYGLVADGGNDSSIGELFGTPYMVVDERNTNCFTLRSRITPSRLSRLPTLLP